MLVPGKGNVRGARGRGQREKGASRSSTKAKKGLGGGTAFRTGIVYRRGGERGSTLMGHRATIKDALGSISAVDPERTKTPKPGLHHGNRKSQSGGLF